MTVFQFVTGGSLGKFESGDRVPIPHPVSLYGSAEAKDVEQVLISIFRIGSSNNKLYATDANGNTIKDVEVTDKLDDKTYIYTFESADDAPVGLYFAAWDVTVPGINVDQSVDRFQLASEIERKGDVEFEEPQPPAT